MDGQCSLVDATAEAERTDYTVPQAQFYDCLKEFLVSDQGKVFKGDLKYTGDMDGDFKLTGFRQVITVKKIDEVADQGVRYLSDYRAIEEKYAVDGTYSYSQDMLDYELYVVFLEETLISVALSLIAVFFVVKFVFLIQVIFI